MDSFNCDSVTDVPIIECQALVALYQSTNGAGWYRDTNWLITNNVGNWFGVSVENGHVFGISLVQNDLIGTIPAQLSYLSSLEGLYLFMNQLSGNIPTELGNLINLKGLYLHMNQLSGSIPIELGNLTKLQGLFLYTNQFSGNIPSQLGNLINLTELNLGNNQLNGSIPRELGNLNSLEFLVLSNNRLNGGIPEELGNLHNLFWLHLAENQLTGNIPSQLGNLTSLESLHLDHNQLTGSIPINFINLINLDYFYFYHSYICEPNTPEFLAWKATVEHWSGTGNICETEADIYFRPNPDGYSFNNWSGINPGDFNVLDMQRMFGDNAVCWKMVGPICIPKLEAVKFMNKMNDNIKGGHCLGMSVSSLRFFRDIDTHDGKESTFDLNKSDTVQINWDDYEFNSNVRKNISYFQVLQYTNPNKEYQDEIIKKTPNEVLNMLIVAMNSGNQDDNILLISRLAGEIGHAVTPYAIENIGNGIYLIKVYDNNYPNNSDQHITVNTNNNTWIYGLYSGDVISKSFGIVPVSLYNQRPICPWCESDLHNSTEQQVWFEGAGHLLITDSQMRKLGFQDGEYYDEIPDAYGSPRYEGLEIEYEPVYTLPLVDEYTITINGLQTKIFEESSLMVFGPDYAVLVDDVSLNANTNDVLTISNDGTSVSYQANQPQIATLGLILNTEDANWQLETKELEMTAGEMRTLTADTSTEILELSGSQTLSGSYDIFFTRNGNDSIKSFYNTGIALEADSTHYLHFDAWQNTGTVQLDIDNDGDGNPDETLYLENQLKMLYLPILWR